MMEWYRWSERLMEGREKSGKKREGEEEGKVECIIEVDGGMKG